MKKLLKILLAVIALLVVAAGGWFWYSSRGSNPWHAATVGDIPTPRGYERVEAPAGSEAAFFRSLPLKPYGSKVKLYTGGDAGLQFLSAAVVDLPMLSNAEQCADMTMRLRAEWLFSQGRYSDIKFRDVNNNVLRYRGGASHKALEKYLKKAYGVCNTTSVYNETEPRQLGDVQPGDVFVYKARKVGGYGHAIIVMDVAKKGKKLALLLAEGNTPARECHILRNPNPLHSAWFIFDGDESSYLLSVFRFAKEGLRQY